MKKLFLSALVVMCAGSAFATETAYILQPLYGRGSVEPCPTAPETPVPANGYCYPGREVALMAMNQPQNTAGMEDTTVAALPAFRTALIPTKRSV